MCICRAILNAPGTRLGNLTRHADIPPGCRLSSGRHNCALQCRERDLFFYKKRTFSLNFDVVATTATRASLTSIHTTARRRARRQKVLESTGLLNLVAGRRLITQSEPNAQPLEEYQKEYNTKLGRVRSTAGQNATHLKGSMILITRSKIKREIYDF